MLKPSKELISKWEARRAEEVRQMAMSLITKLRKANPNATLESNAYEVLRAIELPGVSARELASAYRKENKDLKEMTMTTNDVSMPATGKTQKKGTVVLGHFKTAPSVKILAVPDKGGAVNVLIQSKEETQLLIRGAKNNAKDIVDRLNAVHGDRLKKAGGVNWEVDLNESVLDLYYSSAPEKPWKDQISSNDSVHSLVLKNYHKTMQKVLDYTEGDHVNAENIRTSTSGSKYRDLAALLLKPSEA